MKKNKLSLRNVIVIAVCLAMSMFVACGDKNNCKEINSNFETEYAKYKALHKQFSECLLQCMAIEGYEDAYLVFRSYWIALGN